jgi:hypothetical protein
MRTIAESVLKYLASLPQTPHNMCSFIKKIVVDGDKVQIEYRLPMPPDGKMVQSLSALPMGHVGGPLGTVPELLFEKKGLIPEIQHLLITNMKFVSPNLKHDFVKPS